MMTEAARPRAFSIAAACLLIPASAAAEEISHNKVAAPPAPPAPAYDLAAIPEPAPVSPPPGRKPYIRPSLRVATGLSVRVGGKPVAGYTMDFMVGAHLGLHRGNEQFGLIPEVGYTWRTPGREHQLTAGLGFAWGMGMAYHTIALIPRIVVDRSQGESALGLRTGLLWCFRENGFAAELAYQYKQRAGLALNDIRGTVSIDVMLLALVLAGAKKL